MLDMDSLLDGYAYIALAKTDEDIEQIIAECTDEYQGTSQEEITKEDFVIVPVKEMYDYVKMETPEAVKEFNAVIFYAFGFNHELLRKHIQRGLVNMMPLEEYVDLLKAQSSITRFNETVDKLEQLGINIKDIIAEEVTAAEEKEQKKPDMLEGIVNNPDDAAGENNLKEKGDLENEEV